MAAFIGILCDEHRNIEKLLNILDRELTVFDRSERPDYEILQAVISYFQSYPDKCHHPKEDAIIRILKERNPDAAAQAATIEQEHKGEAGLLQRFATIIERVQLEQELPRQTFHNAMREFIDYQRAHIEKEERLLFPAAEAALLPADWAVLGERMECRKDPLFDAAAEEKFRALRQRLLQWEAENEEDRAGVVKAGVE